MTISVCMGTYNGGKYIKEQLDCIFHQTRQPNEVIICDDGSTDDTVSMIQKFIEKNNLQDSWKLYINQQNKGYPANFYYAMNLCTMDVVFLGDQDDIWDEHKIEKISAVLDKQTEAQVVACKFGLIDGEGKGIRTFMAPSHSNETGRIRRVTIENIFYKYQWPGMVLAYRRAWYQDWTKKSYTIPHDLLITARAAEEGAFLQLDETLAWHRRHENNTAAEEHRIRKLLNKERKLWEIEKYLKMLEQFEQREVLRTEEGRRILQEKLTAMRSRYAALQSGKIIQVLKSAKENRRNVRPATVVCDVLIVRR